MQTYPLIANHLGLGRHFDKTGTQDPKFKIWFQSFSFLILIVILLHSRGKKSSLYGLITASCFCPNSISMFETKCVAKRLSEKEIWIEFSFYVEGQAGSFVILFGAMQYQQENVSLECHDVRYLLITLHYYDSEKGSWCSWVYFIQYFRVSLSVN